VTPTQDAIGSEHELGKPQDKNRQNDEGHDAYRRDADSKLHFYEHETKYITRHEAGKPTPSVVTPLFRDADSEHQSKPKKPQESIWHNAGKPTSSVATPIVPTPTLDTIYSVD
jgi:hypothetical protein